MAAVLYADELRKSPEPAGGGGKGTDKNKSKNKNRNQGNGGGGGRQQGEDGPGEISNGARDAAPPGKSSKKKPYHKVSKT